jgi:hypothetical protein
MGGTACVPTQERAGWWCQQSVALTAGCLHVKFQFEHHACSKRALDRSAVCAHNEVLCQRVSAQCDVASRRLLLAAACAYASGCLVKQAGAVRAIEFGKNMQVRARDREWDTKQKK